MRSVSVWSWARTWSDSCHVRGWVQLRLDGPRCEGVPGLVLQPDRKNYTRRRCPTFHFILTKKCQPYKPLHKFYKEKRRAAANKYYKKRLRKQAIPVQTHHMSHISGLTIELLHLEESNFQKNTCRGILIYKSCAVCSPRFTLFTRVRRIITWSSQQRQGKSRWHSYHIDLQCRSPLLTYLVGDCPMFFDHGALDHYLHYVNTRWLRLKGETKSTNSYSVVVLYMS